MIQSFRIFSILSTVSLGLAVAARADDKAPIKVIIMSGQSNMVGMGRVTGGGSRWGDEFTNPVVSVYEGKYDPKADYDKMKPIKTVEHWRTSVARNQRHIPAAGFRSRAGFSSRRRPGSTNSSPAMEAR